MNTRHANPDSPFRQERYASSPALPKFLLANLVATRCTVLERAEDRELIWFIQYLSIVQGGMEKVAAEILRRFEKRIGTAAMRKISTDVCNAKQVIAIRDEIAAGQEKFLLRGEFSEAEQGEMEMGRYTMELAISSTRLKEINARAATHPDSYSRSAFQEHCANAAASELADYLTNFCLDADFWHMKSALPASGPWYFDELIDCLREYQVEWSAEQSRSFVLSEVGRELHAAIDFAKQTRQMVLVTGRIGLGTTSAAKAWCHQFPWAARYVSVPGTNDRKAFYRALADALGIANRLSFKAQEIEERCGEVLQSGDIALIFDEADLLLPNTNLRESMPDRIQWILSVLLPAEVPVVLNGSPNFLQKLKFFDGKGGWTIDQFTHRLGSCVELPALSAKDLAKIARKVLPGIDGPALGALCGYALSSGKDLATINAAKLAAIYEAKAAQRETPNSEDIRRALTLRILPSDQTLAKQVPKMKVRASMKRAPGVMPQPAREPIAAAPRVAREIAPVFTKNRHSIESVLQTPSDE